jgi:hypothetical protein
MLASPPIPSSHTVGGSGVGAKSKESDRVSYSGPLEPGSRVVPIVAVPDPVTGTEKTSFVRDESVNPNMNEPGATANGNVTSKLEAPSVGSTAVPFTLKEPPQKRVG